MADDAYSGPLFLEELSKIYVRNGQLDQAVELLEEVMSIPYQWALGTTQLGFDPIWVPLGSEPRFQKLLHFNETTTTSAGSLTSSLIHLRGK